MTLIFSNPLSNISNVSVTSLSTTTLTLNWIGKYTSVDISYNNSTQFTGLTGTTQAITGLSANTNYTFSVIPYTNTSINTAGASNCNATTLATVGTVAASSVTDNSLTLTWTNGSQTTIDISYNGITNIKSVSGTSQAITGLNPGRAYIFAIIPKNSANVTNTSGIQTTGTTTTSSILYGVTSRSTTSSQTTIYWIGGFTSVVVTWTPVTGSGTSGIQTGNSYTVTGLTSNTTYTFTITPSNGITSGSALTINVTTLVFITLPTDFITYINASNTIYGASIPVLTGSNLTTWGAFSGAATSGTARPQYSATGGPNNGPRITFTGGTDTGKGYMTCSINCNGTINGGTSIFYYLKGTTAASTRLFVAAGYFVDLEGNGSFAGNYTNNGSSYIPASGGIAYTGSTWTRICHRLYNISGTQCTQDIFINGVLQATRTTNDQAQNATFTRFGQSEFGDAFRDAYWAGDLYALIMYNRKLTDIEVSNIDTLFSTYSI